MTDFEKQINELLSTYRERQRTQDNSNKQYSFNIVTHDIPSLILKRLNALGLYTDIQRGECMTAYAPTDKQIYEATLPMVKNKEYIGDIEIKIKYNTTDDCNNIIKYKLIPYNKETDILSDKKTIEWQVLH